MGSAKVVLLRELARRIHEIEAGSRRRRSRSRVNTGIEPLDSLLPGGGLARGTLVELLSGVGAGAWTLGLIMARNTCGAGVLVIIDIEKQFYPPAAMRLGLDLERTIVVRPARWRDAYQAAVESLRCAAVGAVLVGPKRLSIAEYRRLELAAETGGGVGLLLRPAGALRVPSRARVRLQVTPVASMPDSHHPGESAARCPPWKSSRQVRLEVVRCQGTSGGQVLLLEIDDETGDVHLSARMAAAAAVGRAARTSG